MGSIAPWTDQEKNVCARFSATISSLVIRALVVSTLIGTSRWRAAVRSLWNEKGAAGGRGAALRDAGEETVGQWGRLRDSISPVSDSRAESSASCADAWACPSACE